MSRASILIGKTESAQQVQLDDFNLISEIGRGAFGRVYLVELPATGKKYALKAIRKDKVLEQGIIQAT